MDASGLYLHIPFCQAKCTYCDFCSFPGLSGLYGDYALALIWEITEAAPTHLDTIYFGGGTPSVLPLRRPIPDRSWCPIRSTR